MIVSAAGGIAILFPNIINAFGFIGGTCILFVIIIFPMMLKFKMSPNKWFKPKNLMLVITMLVITMLVLTTIGLACAVFSALDSSKTIDINYSLCVPAPVEVGEL